MAYHQQQRQHYDQYQQHDEYQQPPRQQYYQQGAPQQGRQPAGYDAHYDQQQYDDYNYGYDQGQYEQWDDGSYNQGQSGGWDHGQQRGYGGMNEQPRQHQQPQQHHRQPSRDQGYDQQYQRQPPPRDPRRPMPPPQGPVKKERPRMAPPSPKMIPQDNPFPTFPTQKEKVRPKAGSMEDAMALMNLGPDNAGQGRGTAPPQGRGPGGRPPMQNRGPPVTRGMQPGMQRHDSGHHEDPARGQRPPPNRMPPSRGPPPQQQGFGPPQRAVTMPQNMPPPAHQRRFHEPQQQWAEPQADVGYRGPDSPTYLPPRPTTAGGYKPKVFIPPQNYELLPPTPSRSPQQQQQYVHPPPSQSRYSQEAALGSVLDDDGGDRQSKASIDMPDFDAIQEPPTRGHRRGDSLEDHLSPTAGPSADNVTHTAGAGYARANDFYHQASRSRSQPDLNGQYNIHEMEGSPPPVPAMPPPNAAYAPPNGMPGGPRGRGPPPRGMTVDSAMGQGYASGQPRDFDPYGRHPPAPQRFYSDETTYSEPPPNAIRNASPMAPGNSIRRPGTTVPTPSRAPSDPLGRRPGTTQPRNPDALPSHPAPFRPGLMQLQNTPAPAPAPAPQAVRPPPVRQYSSGSKPNGYNIQQDGPAQQQPPAKPHPVTHDELNRLKSAWGGNVHDCKNGLELAKKLAEAARVLADEGGTADTRTRNKNREKFIMESHKIIKKLVSAGHPDAMFYLADCYGQGRLGLQVDTKEAFTLYQSAAKGGHAAAAYRTAVCCEMGHEEGGGTKRDLVKAVQWYRRGAALGDTPAMYKMGMILLKGLLGQQRHLGEAVNMLKRAADNADAENPHALHELGLLYEAQTGNERILRDEAYAFSLFSQASQLGYKYSQFRLGQAYEYGLLGCPVDPRLSIGWYTKAAAQEEHQSELALSGWYLTGVEGILNQSDTEAYLWARKAACAEPPLGKALFAMGYFTEVGIGCPRSLDEAKRWYGRAAAYKFPKAQERLEELKKGGARAQKNRERLSRTNQKQQEENCVVM